MRSWTTTIVLMALLLPGCALNWHTAPKYRYNGIAAVEVQVRAEAWCAAEGYPAGVPTRPFFTDGCTWWVDGDLTRQWQEACVAHDIAYWCGGTDEDRARADTRLQEDVGGTMGQIMWVGVRPGGHPWIPAGRSRWGYGHDYKNGYPDK